MWWLRPPSSITGLLNLGFFSSWNSGLIPSDSESQRQQRWESQGDELTFSAGKMCQYLSPMSLPGQPGFSWGHGDKANWSTWQPRGWDRCNGAHPGPHSPSPWSTALASVLDLGSEFLSQGPSHVKEPKTNVLAWVRLVDRTRIKVWDPGRNQSSSVPCHSAVSPGAT